MSGGKGKRGKTTRGPTPPKQKQTPLFPPPPSTPMGQLPHRYFTSETIIPVTFHKRFRIMPKGDDAPLADDNDAATESLTDTTTQPS